MIDGIDIEKLQKLKDAFEKNRKKVNLTPHGRKKKMELDDTDKMMLEKIKKVKSIILITIMCFILLIIASFSVKIIPTEHVGVKHLFGKVDPTPIYDGLNFKSPLTKVQLYSGKTEEYTMVSTFGEGAKADVDSITAKTKNNVEVGLDITVLYKIDRAQAVNIWKNIGTQEQIISKIVRPIIRTKVRDIVALYHKDVVNNQRVKIAKEIEESIRTSVQPKGIIVENLLLRDIKFPPEIQEAINDKEREKEMAAKMENTILLEEKEANRKVIEAQGIADANKIIAHSITRNYLLWYWIENIKGNQNVMYVPVGTDGMPMFKDIDETPITQEQISLIQNKE